jgi:hypothetical protein
MTSTKESALSTVRALLQMTEARGCTRAEAAAARAKAFELIEKYGIGLEDLHPRSQTPAAGAQQPVWSTTQACANDAFANAVSNQKPERDSQGARRVTRFVAGCAAVGFLISAFAAFYVGLSTDSRSPSYHEQHTSRNSKTVEPRNLSPEVRAENGKLSKRHPRNVSQRQERHGPEPRPSVRQHSTNDDHDLSGR